MLAPTRQGLHFMHTPVVKVYVSQIKTRNLAYLIAVPQGGGGVL